MTVPPAPTSSPSWAAPAVVAATVLGVGRVPFAPGTFGALVGLPLSLGTGWLATRFAAGVPTVAIEAAIIAGMAVVGIPICTRAASLLGRKDPGAIVLDELVSMPMALLVVSPEARTPAVLLLAFVILRVFDITKPFPCRQLERLPAGLGIMADDWGAAAWTAAIVAIVRSLHWF